MTTEVLSIFGRNVTAGGRSATRLVRLRRVTAAVVFGLALACGVLALVTTSLNGWQAPKIGERQADYYNALVRGFLHGTTALDIPVSDAVHRLQNPWDKANAPLVPMDVSYFEGHYYSYFGVVPAVVVFLPFRLLTGHELPLVYGSLLFAVGGLLIAGLLWGRIVDDCFPRGVFLLKPLGAIVVGLCGGQWVLARRVSIWEPSITSGHTFMIGFVAAAYRALQGRRPFRWLALAAASLALAVGCRPDLGTGLPALGLLAGVVTWRASRDRLLGWNGALLRLVAAALPAACVAAGLLAYNRARFHAFFEFGLHYQLGNHDEVASPHFSLRYLGFNAHYYLFAPPAWGRYFPFLHPPSDYPRPPGHQGYEFAFGLLTICPIVWGVAGLVFLRRLEPSVRWFAAILAVTALALTATLLCFNTATARYEVDFVPWWVWLGALGWALGGERVFPRGWIKAGVCTTALLAALASLFAALLQSATIHGIFEFWNPSAYRALARSLDMPVYAWDRLSGFKSGPVQFDLRFGPTHHGSVEPLMIAGASYEQSYLFLFYQSDRSAKVCFEALSGAAIAGDTFTFEPGRTYSVQVATPALYPPADYPLFDGWSPGRVLSAKNWVRVLIDGKVVLLTPSKAPDASPGSLRFGHDVKNGYGGEAFSGTISHIRRTALLPAEQTAQGIVDLSLHVPVEPSRATAPILQVGKTGDAVCFGLWPEGDGRFRYSLEIWGVGLEESPVRRVSPKQPLHLRVQMGPALPDAIDPIRHTVVVWEEGVPVWWRRLFVETARGPCAYFVNGVNSSVSLPSYNGHIVSTAAAPPLPVWHKGPFHRMTLVLLGRGGGLEPVVSTGAGSDAVQLELHWLPNDTAQWIYRTRTGRWLSPVLPWADGAARTVSIALPSFEHLDQPNGPSEGSLRIAEGSKVQWEATVPSPPSASASVIVGTNGAHFNDCADEFDCALASVMQE